MALGPARPARALRSPFCRVLGVVSHPETVSASPVYVPDPGCPQHVLLYLGLLMHFSLMQGQNSVLTVLAKIIILVAGSGRGRSEYSTTPHHPTPHNTDGYHINFALTAAAVWLHTQWIVPTQGGPACRS